MVEINFRVQLRLEQKFFVLRGYEMKILISLFFNLQGVYATKTYWTNNLTPKESPQVNLCFFQHCFHFFCNIGPNDKVCYNDSKNIYKSCLELMPSISIDSVGYP